MIFLLLFFEFFKIGLFAIGGGLVTIPFLYQLAEQYPWFSVQELVDMIAVAESTPGPIGINMATFVGFKTAGITGSLIATFGLVLPAFITIIVIADILKKYRTSNAFINIMYSIRPAVLALIFYAATELGKLAVEDSRGVWVALLFLAAIRFVKIHPIFYIIIGGILGIFWNL